jgi:O-acetyl-ADP-ribose deacetylase (regulator of RNase III)
MKAPSRTIQWGESTLSLWQGDITTHDVDAVVNAANAALAGGGGVDGAIHRAAGPELLEACRKIRQEQLGGRLLATAEPVITPGFRLPARFVIHVVGPICGVDERPDELLVQAYRRCIALAASRGLARIAFPSISTGAFGCKVGWAAPIALGAILDQLRETQLAEVRMVLFTESDLKVYSQALDEVLAARGWRGESASC